MAHPLAVAIFVSALAANLTTAKTQIRTYATTTVTTLSIPKQAKRDTLRVVDHQLATEQTAQTVHEPITAAKARRLVAANYMQVLKARSLQSAPVRIKAQIHQQVAQKVHSQVKHTNHRIRTAASAIKAKTKIELTAAFMRPYQVAWPFTLLLVMTTWCFAGRERKSGKPS